MQLTTLLDQIRLKSDSLGAAWRGCGLSTPTSPSDANIVSIPTGLAFQTRDGRAYTLRRVRPADAGLLGEFLCGLSAQTRWLRYMTARPCSPEFVHAEVARMVAGSAGNSITLIVTKARDRSEAVVAVAELACTRESGTAEVGVVVIDDAQRKGIGSLLLQQLLRIAQELGLTHLHADMLAENYAIQRLIKALQLSYTATIQSGEMHIIVGVPEETTVSPARAALRAMDSLFAPRNRHADIQTIGVASDAGAQAPHHFLTAREREILGLMAAGMTNPQIAARLVIGAGTVKTHTLNIYRKLEVANRTQAIVRAQELGILNDRRT